QAFINNYCEEPINTSTSNVYYDLNTTSYSDSCNTVERIGANVYKCNWLPDRNATFGYYNVTFYSTLTNYYDNQTTAPNIFYYFTNPLLKVANMTPRHDSWSVDHNFTVNITDNAGDTVNVTLWIKVGASEQSYGMECCGPNCADNTQNCSNLEFNWTNIVFPCSGFAGQTAFYWFAAVDEEGYSYNTTVAQGDYSEVSESDNFGIEEADINVTYWSGNSTQATRLIPTSFTVKVYDLDNLTKNFTTSFPLVQFYVNNSLGNMQLVNQSYANETGFANVTFLPTADFNSGNKTWYAKVPTSDSCYQYNITENLTVDLDVNFPPLYDNEKVRGVTSGASAGWGEYWYFNITVMDLEGDNVNVSLYVDYGDGYRNMQNQTCTNCNAWDIINFTVDFNCTHINSTVYYRFKMIDNNSVDNLNQTTPHTFTIETDDINFTLLLGDSSIANRSDNQTDTLIILVNDTDRNQTVEAQVNGTIWITDSGGLNWDDGYNVSTNSSGHWTYIFNASCNYSVGQQTWRFQSIDQCYDEVDSFYDLSKTYYLTVMGDLNVTLTLPSETNYTEGQSVYFLGNLKDDCGDLLSGFEDYVTFRPWHYSYYQDLTSGAVGGGIYDYSWSTSGGDKPGGWYNITMKAVEKVSNTYYSDEKNFTYPNQTSPLHAFYLEIYPRLREANVTPRQEGWSFERNFTVNVSDEEVDTVDVELWESFDKGVWTKIDGTKQCSNCSNETLWWNRSYLCAGYAGQTLYFKFNGSDSDSNVYTTGPSDYADQVWIDSYQIEKDDITVAYYEGNETYVNRSGSDSVEFILEINDTDRNQLAYDPTINMSFNVTSNGTASPWIDDGFNISNASGHVHYIYEPDCRYGVGNQTWMGYTGTDSCYKVNSSDNYTVTVHGSFLVDPSPGNVSGIYYQDEMVKIYVNVTDDCSVNLSGVNVSILLRYNASINYTCGSITQEDIGNYSCEWQSSQSDPTGNYDVLTTVSLPDLYNNATFIEDDVFVLLSYLNNNPALSNENVTPEGWGALTNFSVDVWDPDYSNNVSVELWESSTGGDPWTWLDNQTCIYCDPGETLNFSVYHDCSEVGLMYYKFNASDAQGGSASTIAEAFNVQKDNITVSIMQGNPTEVNRSGNQVIDPSIIVRIYDDDNLTWVNGSEHPTNTTLWVTYTGTTDWDDGMKNDTNETGFAEFFFDPTPDCSYAHGPRKWIAGTINTSCYDDQNYTGATPDIIIYADLNNTFTNVSCPGGICEDNENVTIQGRVLDDCSNTRNTSYIRFNVSHAGIQYICTPIYNESNGYYNCSWNVTGYPGGWYDIYMWSNETYFNNNTATNTSGFFHELAPNLTGEYASPTAVPWGPDDVKSTIYFYVNVTDDDDNVTLELYVSDNGVDWGTAVDTDT
ncbi:hypothetical protein ACFLQO_01160, partial [Candidatus Aenigmatarchaeota archaeon]